MDTDTIQIMLGPSAIESTIWINGIKVDNVESIAFSGNGLSVVGMTQSSVKMRRHTGSECCWTRITFEGSDPRDVVARVLDADACIKTAKTQTASEKQS